MKDADKARLLNKKHVVGIGEGLRETQGKLTNEPALVVAVSKKVPRGALNNRDLIPKEIHGQKTDVIETGEIPALTDWIDGGWPNKPGGYRHPFMCGDEIGPVFPQQAGTAGGIVRLPIWNPQENTGDYRDCILTNWHVVHSYLKPPSSAIGTQITQPRIDQSTGHSRKIGVVIKDTPVSYDRLNRTDAALVEVQSLDDTTEWLEGQAWDWWNDHQAERLIPWNALSFPHYHKEFNHRMRDISQPWGFLPAPAGFGELSLGMRVRKSGRTSGTTYGTCTVKNFQCSVRYHTGTASFIDQFVIKADPNQIASQPGDSGSVVINEYNHITALLFAGTEKYYVATPIQTVFRALLNHWELEHLSIDERARMLP